MADKSAIEWTDATWNPTTGCTKISPGCAHCYIERTPAFRIPGNTFVKGKTDLTIFHDRLAQPLHWRKPRRVFVNSLSDLFHEDISDAFIDRVFAVMALAPQHTFQVLTKRAERMRAYLTDEGTNERIQERLWDLHTDDTPNSLPIGPLPNVWLGVSVENQHFADERIPLLLQTPAAVRFISAEPLLGPLVGLDQWLSGGADQRPYWTAHCPVDERGFARIPGLDWVIVGGESGPQSRQFDIGWARSIVQRCQVAGVAVFVKQLGANAIGQWDTAPNPPYPKGRMWTLRDKKGGNPDEWPIDLRVREFPRGTTPPSVGVSESR